MSGGVLSETCGQRLMSLSQLQSSITGPIGMGRSSTLVTSASMYGSIREPVVNASIGMHMGSGSSRYDIKGTSGSFDAGYKDGASSFHGVCDNLDMLAGAFPLREGYFGRATRPNNSRVRIIESESPLETAREFLHIDLLWWHRRELTWFCWCEEHDGRWHGRHIPRGQPQRWVASYRHQRQGKR